MRRIVVTEGSQYEYVDIELLALRLGREPVSDGSVDNVRSSVWKCF